MHASAETRIRREKHRKTVSHFWFCWQCVVVFYFILLVLLLERERKKRSMIPNSNNNHNNVGDLCDTVICFKFFFLLAPSSGCFVWSSLFRHSMPKHMCSLCELQSACFFFSCVFIWFSFDLWKILLGKA